MNGEEKETTDLQAANHYSLLPCFVRRSRPAPTAVVRVLLPSLPFAYYCRCYCSHPTTTVVHVLLQVPIARKAAMMNGGSAAVRVRVERDEE